MTHALPLLLALACASDPTAAPPDAGAVQVHDLAALKPAEALGLEGGRRLFRVVVVKQWPGGWCAVKAPGDGGLSLGLPGRHARGEVVFVEAELRIDYGTPSPGAWMYRLEKAAVVEE
jgi:hypothetical protein